MTIKEFKNGAYVTFEKCGTWYLVQCRAPNGELHDKTRCDDYRDARAYYRAFQAVAKQL